ncbi:hypothetical protein HYDPIDRAFT_180357 [Hydnomerulius pinastri MD-312]|nr:hypothetical protein HYDPIDRAFT_180357 [Hydnomerulius pinastri MD-312]
MHIIRRSFTSCRTAAAAAAMTPQSAPVLIAGAGPAGLVAALTLLHNGVPVRIIDKEPNHPVGQRGPGIWPRTFELFHFLRVPEIHSTAHLIPPIREYRPTTLEPSRTFEMVPFQEPQEGVPYRNPKMIGQQMLESILRSHLERRYNTCVELATELVAFEQHETGVSARVKRGEAGEEVVEAAYLVGCDGAKGITRKHLGLSFLGQTREDVHCLLGDVRMEVKGVGRDHWHFFGDRTAGVLTLRPTPEISPSGDGYNFLLALPAATHSYPTMAHDRHALEQGFRGAIFGDADGEVEVREVVWASEFRPNIRMVDRFGVGRVFVAGDAAHVHSPTGGQGLNSGVQDSFNLAWKLALAYKSLAHPALLQSYTDERRPVIAEMLDLTTTLLQQTIAASPAPVHSTPKGEGTGKAGTTEKTETTEKKAPQNAMQRTEKFNMLGVHVRRSPVVVDEYTPLADVPPGPAYGVLEAGVVRAGDRAGDVRIGETRLFDLLDPARHTVLVFAGDVRDAADVVGARGALTSVPRSVVQAFIVLPAGSTPRLVDASGRAYKAYLAEEGETKVVIVRPDGVIGALVRGAEGVQRYFGGIFA